MEKKYLKLYFTSMYAQIVGTPVQMSSTKQWVKHERILFHFLFIQVLPVVVFFSTVVAMLYYLGLMQAIIKQLGRFLAFCLGTSPTESINAAGNIFLGQVCYGDLCLSPFIRKQEFSLPFWIQQHFNLIMAHIRSWSNAANDSGHHRGIRWILFSSQENICFADDLV